MPARSPTLPFSPPESASNAGRRAIVLAAALIALAALAAYSGSFSAPFVFDDDASIAHNATIRRLWSWPGALAPPHGGGQTVEGRPVLNLSFAIDYAISGTRVWSYHALNLLIHISAGLALFGILRRILGRRESVVKAAFPIPALSVAFAAALLWTLHPLQTESVIYVVQRAESLMGLFYLLTLYFFIRMAAAQELGGAATARAAAWGAGSVLACGLGMGTKEVMISAPLTVFLCDRTFVAHNFREAWERRAPYYLALFSTWILLGALILGEGSRGGTVGIGSGVSPLRYAQTQFGAIVHYLRLAVWPRPLVFDYGAVWTTGMAGTVLPGVAVALLFAGTVAALKRWPAAGFLGFWFFAILAPTSSLIPGNRQTIAEHRMYLPLAAVIVPAVIGVYFLARRRAAVLLAAAAVVLGTATAVRNRVYASSLSLYRDTVEKRPENPYAHTNFGFALGDAGRPEEAVGEFKEAIRLKPDLSDAHYNLGLVLTRLGRTAEGIAEYEEAIRLKPDYVEAHYNLALALAGGNRVREAILEYREVVRLQPLFADGHIGLGNALIQAGVPAEAADQFEAAVRAQPDYAEAHYNLGMILVQRGQAPEGISHIEEALRLMPDFEDGHYKLGVIFAQTGRMDRALPELETAVRLNPGHAEAQLDLGNVLLSLGRPADAAARYEAALRLRPDFSQARNNLDLARRQMSGGSEGSPH